MPPRKSKRPSSRVKPEPQSQASALNSLAIYLLIGIALFFAWKQFSGNSVGPQPDDQQIVDGDTKPKPKPKPDGGIPFEKVQGVFIFVHDRSPMSPADLLLITEVDRLCQSQPGLEYRSLDMELDDSEPVQKIKEFAAAKGVKPPFVLFKSTDSDKRNVVPMKAGMTLDEVKKVATK